MSASKPCKDCVTEGVSTQRHAPHPGPRCYTHWRKVVNARKYSAHAKRVETTFGITSEQYWALYEDQGQRCYICQRATGKVKRLAVDHEHDKPGCDHPTYQGCPRCVRALLCGPCNELVGRYKVESLRRAIEVLTDPPAQRLLASQNTPSNS